MPRKRKQVTPVARNELDPFARAVERALDRFADAAWLGAHSPLAAPYFLGQVLAAPAVHEDAHGRGAALQRILLQVSEGLDSELQELLKAVYFQRQPHLDNVGLALALHMAERTFYRMRIKAIQALADRLNPLRPESPIQRATVGRAAALVQALAALHGGRSVYISGPSGIGKSTLGASIVQQWLAGPGAHDPWRVFWYTLRGRFKDRLASLLFALGYCLRNRGAAYTWRQLVADRGVADPERILGLLRYDLNSLQPHVPLLCIDEVDMLHEDVSEHVQILHLLEELRLLCPTILIGQRVVLEADEQIALQGVEPADLALLLRHAQAPPLDVALQQRLLVHTRGNPALILLFAALLRSGDDAEAALQALAKAPSVEALFHRIWRRLADDEKQLLMQLAVFRNPAPLDAWQDQAPLLAQLRQRELVQFDGAGGVQVLPHLQRLLYEASPAELKPLLHLQAADLRETRGETVAAMFHAIAGGQPVRAVWLWFSRRVHELDHGRGTSALTLLNRIAPGDLPHERDRTALHIARAELLELAGRPDEAAHELQATTTSVHSVTRAYVRRYEGYVLEMQGRVEQALAKYREALDTFCGLPQSNEIITHYRLSFLHLYRLHDIKQARKEALLARAKADAFLGDLETMAGRYDVALDYLHSAQSMAQQSGGDLVTLSRIHSHLGVLHLKRGEFDLAIAHMGQAIACDQQRGDEVGPLYDMLNRAAAYTLAGRFQEAYDDAKQGLAMAERIQDNYLISGLAAGVAEACFGLAEWGQAEYYATYSLSLEEEFFRAPALVILGRLRQRQGQYDEGVRLLYEAVENAQRIEDRYTEAYVWRALGDIQQAEGLAAQASAAYSQALEIYTALGLPREMQEVQEQLRQASLVEAGVL
jgi:tetratricopeptide (TPR) repeat protein